MFAKLDGCRRLEVDAALIHGCRGEPAALHHGIEFEGPIAVGLPHEGRTESSVQADGRPRNGCAVRIEYFSVKLMNPSGGQFDIEVPLTAGP